MQTKWLVVNAMWQAVVAQIEGLMHFVILLVGTVNSPPFLLKICNRNHNNRRGSALRRTLRVRWANIS
jgi:hypothetical protein